MIKTLTKTDLETCIYSVRNAGDKERPDNDYNKASVLVLFINDDIKKNSSILMIKKRDNLNFLNIFFILFHIWDLGIL